MELELKNETVSKDNPMKNWLVNYVGNKLKPQNGVYLWATRAP